MPNNRPALADLMRGALVLLASICCTGPASASEDVIWPIPDWQMSTPEEQGMDSAGLARLVAFGRTRSFDSLLIARHGRIVLDAYYAPYTADIPHRLNSSTKAVVGSLIAMVHKDGLLDSFDHPLLDLFADRNAANVDDKKQAMTVQNLLDMTSGFEWDEGFEGGREQSLFELGRSSDWVKFILDRPMAHAPGEFFYYNSGNSHFLSALVARLTGTSTLSYANDKLFGPLGIAPPFWSRDPQDVAIGGWGLSLRPHDMAKIGYLYLRHGEWAGKQLLPPDWVDAVNHATVSMNASFEPGLRYHNQFWALPDRHVYMTVGYHCQVIMVLPDQDIVAAMTARDFCPFGKIADDISGAVKSDAPLSANPDAAMQLANVLGDISTEKPTEIGPTSELASGISGKTYRFPDNDLNIKSFSLSLSGSQPGYEIEIDTRNPANPLIKLRGPIGLDGRYLKSELTSFGLRAAKGSWVNKDTFVADVQYVGLGEQRKFSLSFDGNKVNLRSKARSGREISVDGEQGN
jgi:CubicO group peptidase (beta-lactamase class C family)